jgi:putative tricarboxylic transport membrane protein
VPDAARLRRALPYAVVAAGAGYLYHAASGIEYFARPGVLGPDFWPRAILVLALAVCAVKIAAAFASGRRREAVRAAEEGAAEASRPWMLVGGMVLSAGYVWALTKLGFFTATVPYLAAFIALGGYRRWGVLAAVSILGAAALLFIFMKLVYVSLPLGEGPFQQVTLVLMKLMGIR